MQKAFRVILSVFVGAAGYLVLTGCRSQEHAMSFSETPATPVATEADIPAASAVEASGDSVFRVDAGSSMTFTDAVAKVWLPDWGFDGGDIIDRDPALVIDNTTDAGLFLTEHYGMDSFSCKIPNGKYLAKLYFAETYEGITGPGQRVFSFNVQGHEFKDFDVWVKAGGPNRAYIETVPVEVTNGVFRIDFATQTENPEINAIKIVPQ